MTATESYSSVVNFADRRTDGSSLEGEEESELDFIAKLVEICKAVADQDE